MRTHKLLQFVAVTALAASVECLGAKHDAKLPVATPDDLPTPVLVSRPIDRYLNDLGIQSKVYQLNDQRKVTEVPVFVNNSGVDKELPRDMGGFAQQELEKVGIFATFRSFPSSGLLQIPAMISGDPSKPPTAIYRLRGSLERASEQSSKSKNIRTDVFVGRDMWQSDGQGSKQKTYTLTRITIFLAAESGGVAVPGATVMLKTSVIHDEHDKSYSLYIGGSGFGWGNRVSVTQDFGDALADAFGAAILYVMGHCLEVPYWKCGEKPIFPVDHALENRVRNEIRSMARSTVEKLCRQYLFAAGRPVSIGTPDLTESERSIISSEMQRRGLQFSDRNALDTFAFETWENLPFREAASRVDNYLIERRRIAAEEQQTAAAEEARHQVQSPVAPLLLGWRASERTLALDLTHVQEMSDRDSILALLKNFPACIQLRPTSDKSMADLVPEPNCEIRRPARAPAPARKRKTPSSLGNK